MRDATLSGPAGRALGYTEIGSADGTPVVFFHGAPASRLDLIPFDGEFARRGLRVVSADRPGYGTTSPLPNRSMVDALDDVDQLLGALGIDRFIAAGHSSGGPYALGSAARFGERVLGAVVVAAVTDMTWADAWIAYPNVEVELMRTASEDDAVAAASIMFGQDGSRFLDTSGFELPAPDVGALADPTVATALLESLAEAFKQGVGGYAQDVFVQGRPWPFDVEQIRCRVLVVHGELDDLVPLAHSRHTAGLLSNSALRILSGHGHLTILSELPELITELKPMA